MISITQSRYLFLVEKSATLLLLIYPTLMLVVRGGMNGVFLLMLLLAFAVLLIRPIGMDPLAWQHDWTIYSAAMLSISAAIFISQYYHQHYTAHPHDAASRYWLAIPVFLLLQRLRPNIFTVLQFAFPVAAIIGFLMAKDLGGRSGIKTLDLIHFGDFELILGMLSLLSIDWFGRDKLLLRILKVMGFIAGLAASLASGSRGGWLAIPVFIAILFYFRIAKISLKIAVASVTSVILAATIVYFASTTFHQRVNSTFQRASNLANDVVLLNQGELDNSIGMRWQLYTAALTVFSRHPIFGVGPEGFALEMKPMMEAGKITPDAAYYGRGEVHNDILSKAAGMGLFGLVAILAIYFVPLRLFWQATISASSQIRRAGILGIVFVSGFFVFGLTVEILNLTMATAFYSFTVAVLLSACYNVHYYVIKTGGE